MPTQIAYPENLRFWLYQAALADMVSTISGPASKSVYKVLVLFPANLSLDMSLFKAKNKAICFTWQSHSITIFIK